MRKFKIKNRQKRKYIRKNLPASSIHIGKNWFISVLPLILLALVLMTTLLVTHNLKGHVYINSSNYHLPNVSEAALQLPHTINQLNLNAADNINYLSDSLLNSISWLRTALDPRPIMITIGNSMIFLSVSIYQLFILIKSFIVIISGELFNFITFLYYQVVQSVGSYLFACYYGFWMIYASLMNIVVLILNILTVFAKVITDLIINISYFLWVKIGAFLDSLFYILGTPFRILGAFWEQIRPSMSILGNHLNMTAHDFSNGVNALGSLEKTLNK